MLYIGKSRFTGVSLWTKDLDPDPVYYRIRIRIRLNQKDRAQPDPDAQHCKKVAEKLCDQYDFLTSMKKI